KPIFRSRRAPTGRPRAGRPEARPRRLPSHGAAPRPTRWTWTPRCRRKGSSATLDGKPAKVLRLDGFLLGCRVSAGPHRLRFRYEAPGTGAGVALSAAVLVLAAGLFVWCGRRPAGGGG